MVTRKALDRSVSKVSGIAINQLPVTLLSFFRKVGPSVNLWPLVEELLNRGLLLVYEISCIKGG